MESPSPETRAFDPARQSRGMIMQANGARKPISVVAPRKTRRLHTISCGEA
jgi:hypothetical protein